MADVVQILDVRSGVAIVQADDETPVEVAESVLREFAGSNDTCGCVYTWLLREYHRCVEAQRQGRAWQPTQRPVVEIAEELIVRDHRAIAAAEAERRARQRREEAAERRAESDAELARVEAERRKTAEDAKWQPIPSWKVPEKVRFDVASGGRMVEIAYGTFGKYEACDLDPYKRITYKDDGSVMYYKNCKSS